MGNGEWPGDGSAPTAALFSPLEGLVCSQASRPVVGAPRPLSELSSSKDGLIDKCSYGLVVHFVANPNAGACDQLVPTREKLVDACASTAGV